MFDFCLFLSYLHMYTYIIYFVWIKPYRKWRLYSPLTLWAKNSTPEWYTNKPHDLVFKSRIFTKLSLSNLIINSSNSFLVRHKRCIITLIHTRSAFHVQFKLNNNLTFKATHTLKRFKIYCIYGRAVEARKRIIIAFCQTVITDDIYVLKLYFETTLTFAVFTSDDLLKWQNKIFQYCKNNTLRIENLCYRCFIKEPRSGDFSIELCVHYMCTIIC